MVAPTKTVNNKAAQNVYGYTYIVFQKAVMLLKPRACAALCILNLQRICLYVGILLTSKECLHVIVTNRQLVKAAKTTACTLLHRRIHIKQLTPFSASQEYM